MRKSPYGLLSLLTFVGVMLCVVVLLDSPTALANLGPLEVSFIDVGQGDAALLMTSDGKHVLIDAGPTYAGPTVVAYLHE